MKKITAILMCLAMIAAVSGCDGDNETKQTTSKGGKELVAIDNTEEEDTTEQALEYISGTAPLFRNYLEKRMSYPLTVESTVTGADGSSAFSGIYIKDDKNLAVYTKDASGNEVRVIYTVDKAYQVESATRTIFEYDCGEKFVNDYVKSYLLTISYNEAASTTFTRDTAVYDGKDYDRETLTSGETVVEYYFDTATGDLVYMISGSTVTKMEKLENTVTEEMFKLPSDYDMKDYSELQQRYYEERLAEESAAATE